MAKSIKNINNKLEGPKHVLKAIILADSYSNQFKPLTLEKPRCLLLLANVPLIEYTFEFLALGGVEEVYVFCHAHAQKIKEYIEQSKWNQPASPFSVHTIISSESLSPGDALREMDTRKLIESDFILINGDVVSNVPLKKMLMEHDTRRQINKNAIMTMLVRKANPFHRTRFLSMSETSVFAIEANTLRCLHYEPIQIKPRTKFVSIESKIFNDHAKIEIRNDLIDCNVDICSPEVPALFTENFDYQDIRRDFVHGILTSDLLGKTIYCYIAEDNYAACVQSLQSYSIITRDIICRWAYPYVPDSNLLPGQSYEYLRRHIYKDENVILPRSVSLGSKIIIGSETKLFENTTITNSTIGKNCIIGNDVIIENSYIWDNVVINNGCKITGSIIADDVILGKKSIIQDGAIISFGVKISDEIVISGDLRLTNFPPEKDLKDDTLKLTDHTIVGIEGKGYIYNDSESSNEDSESETKTTNFSSLIYNMEKITISDTSLSSIPSEEFEQPQRRSSATMTTMSDESDAVNEYFYREALSGLEQAFDENHAIENVILEIHSLRMSTNVSYSEVRNIIIMAFLNQILKLLSQGGKSVEEIVQQYIKKWILLLEKMTFTDEDREEALLALQELCSKQIEYMKSFPSLLKLFYIENIVEEDHIYTWFNNPKAKEGSLEKKRLYKIGAKFVTWLQNAEETSD
ncbi:translation initiation factor eIF2B catalytic subunit epsilon [Pneumocystis jirovecii RU7]|uniref:Translation initiation factor eIF2B subunit epsilon n=1 Tax=Pneumocystis jirovecii (strain RU7) TaxID=1408657 RepID=A0A0W4ZRQ0_PNEJ7|nr:translation initiation factor eIF2B catalytic subunit epsilon [Pneumocystis jirovecii RU7]KTW31029.1 hypothetical protein T551_01581 [Pneumocystis jirovecii RU7]